MQPKQGQRPHGFEPALPRGRPLASIPEDRTRGRDLVERNNHMPKKWQSREYQEFGEVTDAYLSILIGAFNARVVGRILRLDRVLSLLLYQFSTWEAVRQRRSGYHDAWEIEA
jgi:hypothetical protein